MMCPVCKVELRLAERQGVEIDYCPQCRGIWLDRGELDKIIEREAANQASFRPEPVAAGYQGNNYRAGYHHDDDDYEDYRYKKPNRSSYETKGKRKSFLGEIFDFD